MEESKYYRKISFSNLYGVMNAKNTTINHSSQEEGKHGYMLSPYITKIREKSSKQYDEFMKEYHNKHKYCPKCGDQHHTTTLLGYVLNLEKKEEYKDMNTCECKKCGDVHHMHDRV